MSGTETVARSRAPTANSMGVPNSSWPLSRRERHSPLANQVRVAPESSTITSNSVPRSTIRERGVATRKPTACGGTLAVRLPTFQKYFIAAAKFQHRGPGQACDGPLVEMQLRRSGGQFQEARREPVTLGQGRFPRGPGALRQRCEGPIRFRPRDPGFSAKRRRAGWFVSTARGPCASHRQPIAPSRSAALQAATAATQRPALPANSLRLRRASPRFSAGERPRRRARRSEGPPPRKPARGADPPPSPAARRRQSCTKSSAVPSNRGQQRNRLSSASSSSNSCAGFRVVFQPVEQALLLGRRKPIAGDPARNQFLELLGVHVAHLCAGVSFECTRPGSYECGGASSARLPRPGPAVGRSIPPSGDESSVPPPPAGFPAARCSTQFRSASNFRSCSRPSSGSCSSCSIRHWASWLPAAPVPLAGGGLRCERAGSPRCGRCPAAIPAGGGDRHVASFR